MPGLLERARALYWSGGVIGGRARTITAPAASGHVAAGAGRVALSRSSSAAGPSSAPPYGFGPPLEPFTYDGYAPPWYDRAAAMSLPTISRCRDLICSAVAALPFTFWQIDWNATPAVERQVPPLSWHTRPDPDATRQWMLSWTVDDLIFYERAHWLITSRFAASDGGWPATFRRIPPGALQVNDDQTVSITDGAGRITRHAAADIVEFCSPVEGLLSNGYRAISIALQLDAAADRFAAAEVPAGVLEEQDGAEDMDDQRLAELAEQFAIARHSNTTAATNKYVKYREIPYDASAMQLVEGRQYQALELSRLGNIPPYLAGAPAGTGMTYLNAAQAKADLIDFGAGPLIGCIEQTLSGPNVTPRNLVVRLDLNAWLRNPFTTGDTAEASPNDAQIADPTNPDPVP